MEEIAARFPKAKILNQQIHAVLVSLTTTGTVAFDIVKGTKKNMGLDVWRKLNRKFDPNIEACVGRLTTRGEKNNFSNRNKAHT